MLSAYTSRILLAWPDIHAASAFMTFTCATAPQTAMTRTKKLCAVIVDTLGREVMVRRPCVFGPDGWPAHPGDYSLDSTLLCPDSFTVRPS